MEIRTADLDDPKTIELIRIHLAGMHANSPAGSVFALDLSGLQRSDVSVWSAWQGEDICGIAALRQFDRDTGEVKSMRTHPDHLRRGVARALLEHIITVSTSRGLRKLSLETGTGPAFEPAIAMYRRRGFRDGDAFADYVRSEFNQFMHLDL